MTYLYVAFMARQEHLWTETVTQALIYLLFTTVTAETANTEAFDDETIVTCQHPAVETTKTRIQ